MQQPSQNMNQQNTAATATDRDAKYRSAGWLVLSILLMFLTMLAQQARASIPSIEDSGSGQLLLENASNGYTPAVLLATEVSISVKGLNAAVTVTQTFTNPTNDWLEGVYVFPLPENSAVNSMRMAIGERVVIGEVQEKSQARATYNRARNAGKKAALVEQERPNLFTQSVANISPGETVSVQLRYLQPVSFEQNIFSLRFPMTLTPRYVPGVTQEPLVTEQHLIPKGYGWALPTDQVPDADRVTPYYIPPAGEHSGRNSVDLRVTLDTGIPITAIKSATHSVHVNSFEQSGRALNSITLNSSNVFSNNVLLDRDFELQWQPLIGEQAQAAVFHEHYDGDSYLQLMLMPPHVVKSDNVLARELILIIDTSGSMQGASMQQAKQSLQWALDNLKDGDYFNVIAFESVHQELFREPVPATKANIALAHRFVDGLEARGGTEMAPALQAALSYPAQKERLQQVVFVTDGSVANETQLFDLIDKQLGRARLFTVGIGSAPNSYFMRKAAEFGRGSFTYIGDVQQVNARMADLFSKLKNPVMSGITLEWPVAKSDVELFPTAVPDLYMGEPLFVNAKIRGGLTAGSEISVSGRQGKSDWVRHMTVPVAQVQSGQAEELAGSGIIAPQWARGKIASLLDEKVKGRSAEEIRQAVLAVALPFQLLSPYTSFVAVEQQISRAADAALRSEPVPNEVPAGQSVSPLMYPQTATPASFNFLSGLMALGLLWVIRRGLTS